MSERDELVGKLSNLMIEAMDIICETGDVIPEKTVDGVLVFMFTK